MAKEPVSLLDSVLKTNTTGEAHTDDLFEKAREMKPGEFGQLFSKKAQSHSGFSAKVFQGPKKK